MAPAISGCDDVHAAQHRVAPEVNQSTVHCSTHMHRTDTKVSRLVVRQSWVVLIFHVRAGVIALGRQGVVCEAGMHVGVGAGLHLALTGRHH